MVVFFESGRLGNQLLQYAVLRSRFPGRRLVFVGLASLQQAVACRDSSFVPADGAWRPIAGLLRRVLGGLATLRLISEAREVRDGGVCRLEQRRGLLGGLLLVRPAYFQHACFEPDIPPELDLAPDVVASARRYLAEVAGDSPGRTLVFVHLRRGDYLRFPDPAAPAVLDDAWVLQSLRALRSLVPAPRWLVCSDDLAHARRLLAGEDAVFCDRGELGDLAAMSLCVGGVLSPSSYSWWAAFLARRRLAAVGCAGIFLAPRHWVGHRRGQWYPAGFEFPWIRYS